MNNKKLYKLKMYQLIFSLKTPLLILFDNVKGKNLAILLPDFYNLLSEHGKMFFFLYISETFTNI